MKYFLVILFVLWLPFSAYSAPDNSPLGGFEGSPRHEDKALEIEEDIDGIVICKIPQYGYLALNQDQNNDEAPQKIELYTCLWA